MAEISQVTAPEATETWSQPPRAELLSPEPALAGRLVLLLLTLVVLLLLAGAGWLQFEVSARQPQGAKPDLQRLAAWQMAATGVAAGTGVVLLGLLAFGFQRIRGSLVREWNAETVEWEKTVQDLRARLAERRTAESALLENQGRLRSQLAECLRERDQLYAQFNRSKLAEEMATHQRRELVRSKDVLELHVQARTEQLQKLQRASELILNSAGEGICGLDATGRVTFINPAAAKMMGEEVSRLVGQPANVVFPEFFHVAAAGESLSAEGTPSEVVVTRRDGGTFGAEFIRTSIRENNLVMGEVLLFKDITERKRAAEALAQKVDELARSNAELEQFAFVASHDLQEPLRKIQAFGDRLKQKCEAVNLAEGRDYLERMQNAAARMQTLIYDLLTFSRVISRTEPFVRVDLMIVAREVIGDLEVRIEKTGGKVEVGALPTIEADAPQMRQLLQNLIGNALKFHAPGQSPVVKVDSRLLESPPGEAGGGQRYELTVSDNGIGFDEKYLDRIFAVFQRLHGRQEYEGTGIGLAVCRRIVDRHGGTITARSKPGEGATFIITLPARQAVPQKANS
jgi:PAS domain S-box-containing protein